MNLIKSKIVLAIASIVSVNAMADPATYNAYWQTNKNVTIEKIYVHWDTSATRLLLSNGEVCHIAKEDKELYSAALAMHAQKSTGELVCELDGTGTFLSTEDRRLHRLAY